MIEIKNVSKKYGKDFALHNINLSLPRYGLIAIKGPSGCGKTTLLNCLAGLLSFEGSIKVDNRSINCSDDDEMSNYRLSNVGFIFQDFRLFENEMVFENVLFPLETLTNMNKERKQIKCDELLKLVGLNGKEKQYVSTLSGGEKQRVCIARSLVNDPKIILADEPTGALDEKTSDQIMEILEKISSSSLIIFVTHDDSLAKEYGDQIIEMRDGKIISNNVNNHHEHKTFLPILKNGHSNKKPSISPLFLLKHGVHAMFRKKTRSMICTAITSLGLIGVGIAASLSTFISSNISEAYSSLIKKDQIMISLKDKDKTIYGEYAGSIYETGTVKDKYFKYIHDIGVVYKADFETFFPDSNELCIDSTIHHSPIRGFTARNINEFEWLDVTENTFLPRKPVMLEEDEVCLGLNAQTIYDICYLLQIERTIESFSKYIANNDLRLVFNLENLSWEYSDQQIVTVRGFCLEPNLKIYHYNHLWNEYMIETRMRFPTSDAISENDYYPWVMKKIPYVYCKDNIDEFLTYSQTNDDLKTNLFEIASNKYFPLLYKDVDVKDRRRVLVFSNTIDSIPLSYINYFYNIDKNLEHPLIGGSTGYVIYPGSLMMGFSETTFASFDINNINDAIDIETNVKLSGDQSIKYPEEVIDGHFTKTMQNGLNFAVCPESLMLGNKPNSLDEIVISKDLFKYSFTNNLNEEIYISFPTNTSLSTSGEVLKDYKVVPLKVVGVVNEPGYKIYHDYTWPISFFQSRLGISIFQLKTKTISFSLKNSKLIEQTISRLKKGFPQFEIVNPLSNINESVDELCGYISIVSVIFSIVASITSILLLSICTYLHIYESRREIGLARCIGINKKEANKFIYSHSLLLCGSSLISSSVELLVISLTISYELTGKITILVSPLSYVFMILLSIAISFLSSLVISSSINRNNPIEALKY